MLDLHGPHLVSEWVSFCLYFPPSFPHILVFALCRYFQKLHNGDECVFFLKCNKALGKYCLVWSNLWPEIPGPVTPEPEDKRKLPCMRSFFRVYVCVHMTHIRWWSAGLWENVRKQQLLLLHVSGHWADPCGKELKQASVHLLSCQCCGLAVGLCLFSVRQVSSSLREWVSWQ